jgi:hypothetical protein
VGSGGTVEVPAAAAKPSEGPAIFTSPSWLVNVGIRSTLWACATLKIRCQLPVLGKNGVSAIFMRTDRGWSPQSGRPSGSFQILPAQSHQLRGQTSFDPFDSRMFLDGWRYRCSMTVGP